MTEPSERILTSLAILKANWDEGQRSYLDNFLPFVADCMNACNSSEISATELSELVLGRFGIPLPSGVVQTLLKKAAREGLGRRAQGRFQIDRAAVAKYDLTWLRSDPERRQKALVDRLVRFAGRSIRWTWTETLPSRGYWSISRDTPPPSSRQLCAEPPIRRRYPKRRSTMSLVSSSRTIRARPRRL
jgi:hypothetical protein